ncbi:hypothetical protein NCHU2750_04200 [Neorhizobium sp. NCHU2750]|nr:hypothetical protein NCHU2750_04200 [Neorhizobium sp. NCHU2750]
MEEPESIVENAALQKARCAATEDPEMPEAYLIRPMRKALATAWVRLTVSSFLAARLR